MFFPLCTNITSACATFFKYANKFKLLKLKYSFFRIGLSSIKSKKNRSFNRLANRKICTLTPPYGGGHGPITKICFLEWVFNFFNFYNPLKFQRFDESQVSVFI